MPHNYIEKVVDTLGIDDFFKLKIFGISKALIDNNTSIGIIKICLFGSVSRGTATMSSDLDFLVLVEHDSHLAYKKIRDLELDDDIGRPNIDITVRTIAELKDDTVRFNTEIKKDAIILWERD